MNRETPKTTSLHTLQEGGHQIKLKADRSFPEKNKIVHVSRFREATTKKAQGLLHFQLNKFVFFFHLVSSFPSHNTAEHKVRPS